jgi:predicted N-formylglutamate amidohydrolase
LTRRLILSCEHGGNVIPRAYRLLFRSRQARAALAGHRGWDEGALPLAEHLADALGAPLFAARVSRLLVDLNRSAGHPHLFSEFSRPLDRPARERLLARYYLSHRQRLMDALRAVIRQGHAVCHVAVHSFAPRLKGQERLADVGLLYDPSRPPEREFCRRWTAAIRNTDTGLRVRRNYPYLGKSDGLTTFLRRELGAGDYLGVELEVNQRLLRRESCSVAAVLAGSLAAALEAPRSAGRNIT